MRNRLRRYPALGFLAVAALLASLLPSALRVPLSGPTASAELAPVPGKSDSAQGDLAALGQTSTGGLGSGSGIGGVGSGGAGGGSSGLSELEAGEAPPPPPGAGRNPRNKRCVGNPPRQTEDPLSPPCVAFFKGDNFGATAKGVTGEEIVAVAVGSNQGQCNNEPEFFDYDDEDDPRRVPELAAYVRYFNERFQTYGRRVHLYGVLGPCISSGDTTLRFLREADGRYHPFFFTWYQNQQAVLEAARLGSMATLEGVRREVMARGAPFVLSHAPDFDNLAESAAEFLCARLAGRPARFALDPALQGQRRKFGLLYRGASHVGGPRGAEEFTDRVRARCGEAAGEIVVGNDDNEDLHGIITRMRVAGVTTAVPFWTESLLPNHAAAAGWHPEWFLPDHQGVGRNVASGGSWSSHGSSAFGIASRRRLGAPSEQPYRRAWTEGCACAEPAPGNAATVYDTFFLLFSGIQAAGPRLTPANVDRGLHALPARQSLDPFTPSAYFAPGNYSFVKDWAAMWWDPAGRPPGTNNVGCWRLVEDGLRYRAEDWQKRPGDEGIQGENQPCQGAG